MAISKRLRYEILRRDNHACRYCGRAAPDVQLHIDHVVPVALGGADDPTNLATSCADCNGGKSSVPADSKMVDDVAHDAHRWAKAMQSAAEMDRARRESDKDFAWDVVSAKRSGRDVFTVFNRDYERTILQFRDLGLDESDMNYALDAVVSRGLFGIDRWKYFCGVCWSMIKTRQANALSMLDSEDC